VKIALIATALLLLTGCAARQSGEDTTAARETTDPRAALYKRKCIACHNLVLPTDHDDDQWIDILKEHQNRIHLSENDRIRLIEYVTESN
jgi:cytochrome c5